MVKKKKKKWNLGDFSNFDLGQGVNGSYDLPRRDEKLFRLEMTTI